MTAKVVINHLVNDGLALPCAGKGTFVSPIKMDESTNRIQNFREQIEEKEYQYHIVLNEFAFRGEKVNINVEVRDKRAFLFVDA